MCHLFSISLGVSGHSLLIGSGARQKGRRAHFNSAVIGINKSSQSKMADETAKECCHRDLNLRPSDGSERGISFWNVSQVEMKFSVERMWIKAVRKSKRKPNYGMLNMDAQLEEVVGNKLELVGPLLDSYLREIGKAMKGKLSRSKATGLVNPVNLFIPWTVFRHMLVWL